MFAGLKFINCNYSPGPDGVPSANLKYCARLMYMPLTDLLNWSLAFGCFPSIWKESYIVPLHKNDSRFDIEN